jgi:hypothetical protein
MGRLLAMKVWSLLLHRVAPLFSKTEHYFLSTTLGVTTHAHNLNWRQARLRRTESDEILLQSRHHDLGSKAQCRYYLLPCVW